MAGLSRGMDLVEAPPPVAREEARAELLRIRNGLGVYPLPDDGTLVSLLQRAGDLDRTGEWAPAAVHIIHEAVHRNLHVFDGVRLAAQMGAQGLHFKRLAVARRARDGNVVSPEDGRDAIANGVDDYMFFDLADEVGPRRGGLHTGGTAAFVHLTQLYKGYAAMPVAAARALPAPWPRARIGDFREFEARLSNIRDAQEYLSAVAAGLCSGGWVMSVVSARSANPGTCEIQWMQRAALYWRDLIFRVPGAFFQADPGVLASELVHVLRRISPYLTYEDGSEVADRYNNNEIVHSWLADTLYAKVAIEALHAGEPSDAILSVIQNMEDLGIKRGRDEVTLLHVAADEHCIPVVEFLVRRANVNEQDARGNTPLHYAMLPAYRDAPNGTPELLVRNGASLDIVNTRGQTPASCDPILAATLRRMQELARSSVASVLGDATSIVADYMGHKPSGLPM